MLLYRPGFFGRGGHTKKLVMGNVGKHPESTPNRNSDPERSSRLESSVVVRSLCLLESVRFVWSHPESFGVIRSYTESFGIVRSRLELFGDIRGLSCRELESTENSRCNVRSGTTPTLANSKRLRLTPDDSGRLRMTPDDFGRLRTAPDDSGWLRNTPNDFWWLQMTPDDSDGLGTTPNDFSSGWLAKALNDSERLLMSPDDLRRPRLTPDNIGQLQMTPTPDDTGRLQMTPTQNYGGSDLTGVGIGLTIAGSAPESTPLKEWSVVGEQFWQTGFDSCNAVGLFN